MLKDPRRLKILYKIDNLTANHCKGCSLRNPDFCHNKCSIGKEFQSLGAKLEQFSQMRQIRKSQVVEEKNKAGEKKIMAGKAKINMTVKEFIQWKYKDGLSYSDIAKKFGVVDSALHYWKSTRTNEIEKELEAAGIKNIKLVKEEPKKLLKENALIEYQKQKNEVANQLSDDKERLNEKLLNKIEKLENRDYENHLKEQVTKLEVDLKDSNKEKELLLKRILELKEELGNATELSALLDKYKEENEPLRNLVRVIV